MKAKIILVALALFLGATGYTVQAQCSADCQCGKTPKIKPWLSVTVKLPILHDPAGGCRRYFFHSVRPLFCPDRGAARICIQNYYSCEK